MMKILLGTAVALAGMTFGISNVSANPAISCQCNIILKDGKTVQTFNGSAVEHVEITRGEREHGEMDHSERGNVDAKCKVDLGRGPQVTPVIFDFKSTGFSCSIDGVATNDWQEVVMPSGQTRLHCHIGQQEREHEHEHEHEHK